MSDYISLEDLLLQIKQYKTELFLIFLYVYLYHY